MDGQAKDNGCCPHCERTDAVREIERTEVYSRSDNQRFTCGGCGAIWSGVRHPITIKPMREHRAVARVLQEGLS